MKKYIKTNFCGIVTPSKKNNALEFNQCMKSDKITYIIYADMKSLIKKTNRCANNPEITTKIGEHNSCGYSMSKNRAFNNKESKHSLYHGEDCIKKFCESLREHAKNIIGFGKKKMLPLRKEELKSHQDAKACCICGILQKLPKNKNYRKVRDHWHYTDKFRGAVHGICKLKFIVPNEIPVVFHDGSNCDYNFIIKELANAFRGKF